MKRIALALVLSVCTFSSQLCGQDFVPRPVSVEEREGFFRLPTILRIYYSPQVAPLADYLEAELRRSYRFDAVRKTESDRLPSDTKGIIQIYVDSESGLPAEGYWLNVSGRDILIAGADYGGVFNGIQTLLQMLPDAPPFCDDCKSVDIPVKCINITDYPRFEYRGMMLDVARTFVPKETVMRYIDNLSRHKINRFHWHLANDEGWRIEIKSHPELAEVGGFRGGDSPIRPVYGAWKEKYGGYYTQEDIREIVAYAAVRNVEIIPEIDLPGHSRAVARVVPDILCDGEADTVATNGYDARNVWCVSREENYELLDDILSEISALFPSRYIHIGGDEVDYGQWRRCPHCRDLMASCGFSEAEQLEALFMERVCAILARYGKCAAVWNEAAEAGRLPSDVRVHGWESVDAACRAARAGYATVVMPSSWFYFDMKYTAAEPGLRWAGLVPTEKVYSFDPRQSGLSTEEMRNVVGVEGALWHELGLLGGATYIDRQSYPRVCALAEVAWTPQEQRDWVDFECRMERTHYARLSRMGIRYRIEPAVQETQAEVYITPEFAVESSLRARTANPFSILTDYRWGRQARTTRGARPGDYVLFVFAAPVDCRSIEIVTGFSDLPRCLFVEGYAEVSYEHEPDRFVRIGELENGRITIRPAVPIVAVRIVSTGTPTGDESVIFQPLKIVAR